MAQELQTHIYLLVEDVSLIMNLIQKLEAEVETKVEAPSIFLMEARALTVFLLEVEAEALYFKRNAIRKIRRSRSGGIFA